MKTRLSPTAAPSRLLGLALALACQQALAQAPSQAPSQAPLPPPVRDPMQAPPAAREPLPAAAGEATAAPAPPVAPRQLMSVDGRRYVVQGTRRLAVGDTLGGARIERIDDSAVWLREGGTLQRLAVHGAARRLPAPESPPEPAGASRAGPQTPPSVSRPSARGAPR